MTDARAEVLGAIRAALADRPVAPAEADDASLVAPAAGDAQALVARFVERVADYRATVHVATDPDEVRVLIAEACARHGVTRLAVPSGFPAALVPADLDRHELAAGEPPDIAALDRVDGVLTTCAIAIAETGTLVLDGGPGQGPRAASLLPDVHVCVVAAAAIVPGVAEAVARIGRTVAETGRAITMISGPSATSDIELDRVEGVHGPRQLEVIVAR